MNIAHFTFTHWPCGHAAGWHWANAGGVLVFAGAGRPDLMNYDHPIAAMAPDQTRTRITMPAAGRYVLAARSVAPSGTIETNRHVQIQMEA